jgi:ribosome recycling factor
MAEEGRVAVRNVRRHAKSEMENLHGEISDDDIRKGEDELQKLTDRHIERIDKLVGNKEEELIEV